MRRRMVEVAGRQALYLVLGGMLGRFVPYFGWVATAWLLGLVAARLSRRDEFEADAYATALMVRSGIGALPVVDASGLLVGLLSDKELMRHMLSNSLLPGAHSRRTPPQGVPGVEGRRAVRDVMTRQVLAVSPEQPLAEVASLMTNKDVAHVPVVSEGKLIGFLTRGDIVRKLIGS